MGDTHSHDDKSHSAEEDIPHSPKRNPRSIRGKVQKLAYTTVEDLHLGHNKTKMDGRKLPQRSISMPTGKEDTSSDDSRGHFVSSGDQCPVQRSVSVPAGDADTDTCQVGIRQSNNEKQYLHELKISDTEVVKADEIKTSQRSSSEPTRKAEESIEPQGGVLNLNNVQQLVQKPIPKLGEKDGVLQKNTGEQTGHGINFELTGNADVRIQQHGPLQNDEQKLGKQSIPEDALKSNGGIQEGGVHSKNNKAQLGHECISEPASNASQQPRSKEGGMLHLDNEMQPNQAGEDEDFVSDLRPFTRPTHVPLQQLHVAQQRMETSIIERKLLEAGLSPQTLAGERDPSDGMDCFGENELPAAIHEDVQQVLAALAVSMDHNPCDSKPSSPNTAEQVVPDAAASCHPDQGKAEPGSLQTGQIVSGVKTPTNIQPNIGPYNSLNTLCKTESAGNTDVLTVERLSADDPSLKSFQKDEGGLLIGKVADLQEKDDTLQELLPGGSDDKQVTFQTPLRTPKAIKSFSPSAWSALRELDDQERWVERTSVVTKQDHGDYELLASEFLKEIVHNLPIREDTIKEQAEPTPVQLGEFLVPDTAPNPTDQKQDDLLVDFMNTFCTENKNTCQQQSTPVYDPFSPQREVNPTGEQPEKVITGVVEEAKAEVEAVPSIDLATPRKNNPEVEETSLEEFKKVIEPKKEEKIVEPISEPSTKELISPLPPVDRATDLTESVGSSNPTDPIMDDVSKNIYDLGEEDLQGKPFASSNKMQNSPPLPRAKSSGYNINFDEIADPFGIGTQLSNSPPKSSPRKNKTTAIKRKSPSKASPKKDDSSPESTTTNGEMNTTPSPDTDAEIAPVNTSTSDAAPIKTPVSDVAAVDAPASDLALTGKPSSEVAPIDVAAIDFGVESGGSTSPNTEEYVDAVQAPETMVTSARKQQELVEATDEFNCGGDEDFRPATEVFCNADSAAFDMSFLEKAGTNSNFKESALARQSLYVKFDPLVNAAVSAGPPNSIPNHIRCNTIVESDDLLQMQTPPPKGSEQSAERLNDMQDSTDTPVDVDKLLAYSPPRRSLSSSDEADGGQRLIPSPGSGNSQEDIVQVLRYSQADLQNAVRAAREAEKKAAKAQKVAFEEERTEHKNQVADKDQTIENMMTSNADLRALVTEYEKAMQEMMNDMSKMKNSQDSQVTEVQKEKDQALEDLASVEGAFSDLHRRYEKIKQVAESLKKNEQILRDCVADYKTKQTKQEQKYHTLKAHAEEKIEKANAEIDKVKSSYEAEITGLQAAVKREQMKVSSQERQIEQKTRDNAELTKICDELIAKMGSARS